MAQEDDTRTPEQLDAFAASCSRCAAEAREQGALLMQQADEWDRLAEESRSKAAERRGEAPAAKKAGRQAAKRSAR